MGSPDTNCGSGQISPGFAKFVWRPAAEVARIKAGFLRLRLALRQATKTTKFAAEYSLLWLLTVSIGLMPLDRAAQLSGWLWQVVAPHLGRHRRADRHLAEMMPALPAAERRRILRAMWRNLGRTFVEALQLRKIALSPDWISLSPACAAALQRTKAEGGIIVAPHLGNWEAAVIPLAALGSRHAAVYRRAKNPLAERLLLAIRAPFYAGGLFPRGDAAALRVMKHVRVGGSVGIMADQRTSDGAMVPFFGRMAPSTIFPALLARQFRRPLFAVCVVREPSARFRMEVHEIEVPRTADKAQDIHATTAEIQRVFEGWIRQWPEQWMWAHQRYDREQRA